MKKTIINGLILGLSAGILGACGAGGSGQDASTKLQATAAACYAAWNSATAYNGGQTASYANVNYVANWWTQGQNPSTNNGPSGSGQPWTSQGACGSTPTPTPAPTPAPTPTPTPAPTPAPTPTPTPAPTPAPTPTSTCTLQAEDYSTASDTTTGNTGGVYRTGDVDIEATSDTGGGYDVGWIDTGEWLAHNNVTFPTTGNYTIQYRVASPNSTGVISADLNSGSIQLGTTAVPNTGGYQTWSTVQRTISVNAGTYNLGTFMSTGGFNLNWIKIVGASCSATPTPTPAPTPAPTPTPAPNFGPNVLIFDPSMAASTIQGQLNNVFNTQQTNQFGSQRYALLFKPGTYSVDVNVGFYTQVAGLGTSPDNVVINGAVHAEADWFQGNATQNFWRAAENMSVNPSGGLDRWAVSQASPFRRMHIRGNLALDDGGWSSGGFLADSKIDGQVNSGSQQQWFTRNSQLGSWAGASWNMVFVGVNGAPSGASWPNPPYTVVGQAPVLREKPFLTIDSSGKYSVFVPALSTNAQGTSWASGSAPGQSIPIDQFYIAKSGDTAASINSALSAGKNLLITPGVYHLSAPINVTRANTVVLGLGLATLVPDNGVKAMTVADVDGVKIAGLLFDAGTTSSPSLLEVGPVGNQLSHSANPTSLHDLFFRVGGATVGKAAASLVINSNDVIGDHFWIWRADHGNGGTVGWTVNTTTNGLIVNGLNVTVYGLFVEHFHQYQTVWNADGGRVYFYQSEAPYDVPNQGSWMSPTGNGYASYKVADWVKTHQAYGVGVYCFFSANNSVKLNSAIEVPSTGLNGAMFHNMTTISLGGVGEITHVINVYGNAANSANNKATLAQ